MTSGGQNGRRKLDLYLPVELRDHIDAAAETLDVDTSVWVIALISEAVRKGTAGTLVLSGLDKVPHKRRARKRRTWEAEGGGGIPIDTGGGPEAAAWRHGEWTLVRLGHPGHQRRPDEGWFLEGPGVADATHVGWTRGDAIDNAEQYLRRWERAQATPQVAP